MNKPLRKDHGSKWTAEFLVASELSRRGYTVAFTQGSHTPLYDLMVGTPSGETFTVDVKGQATPGAWLVKDKKAQPRLFYILAMVPPGGMERTPDQLFILTQAEALALTRKHREKNPKRVAWSQFTWKDALPFKDAWHKLPSAKVSA